jgi:MSHA biogenesis protein MshP
MRPEARQHGFGLVAAMFVIIIITAVITAMARLAETQNATNSMAIQQARAYQAARAGLEYGVAQVLAGGSCDGFSLDGFSIGVICAAQAGVLVPEENQTVTFHAITASAEYGVTGSPDYAYRRLTAVVER